MQNNATLRTTIRIDGSLSATIPPSGWSVVNIESIGYNPNIQIVASGDGLSVPTGTYYINCRMLFSGRGNSTCRISNSNGDVLKSGTSVYTSTVSTTSEHYSNISGFLTFTEDTEIKFEQYSSVESTSDVTGTFEIWKALNKDMEDNTLIADYTKLYYHSTTGSSAPINFSSNQWESLPFTNYEVYGDPFILDPIIGEVTQITLADGLYYINGEITAKDVGDAAIQISDKHGSSVIRGISSSSSNSTQSGSANFTISGYVRLEVLSRLQVQMLVSDITNPKVGMSDESIGDGTRYQIEIWKVYDHGGDAPTIHGDPILSIFSDKLSQQYYYNFNNYMKGRFAPELHDSPDLEKWSGASVSPKNDIYFTPCSHSDILKISEERGDIHAIPSSTRVGVPYNLANADMQLVANPPIFTGGAYGLASDSNYLYMGVYDNQSSSSVRVIDKATLSDIPNDIIVNGTILDFYSHGGVLYTCNTELPYIRALDISSLITGTDIDVLNGSGVDISTSIGIDTATYNIQSAITSDDNYLFLAIENDGVYVIDLSDWSVVTKLLDGISVRHILVDNDNVYLFYNIDPHVTVISKNDWTVVPGNPILSRYASGVAMVGDYIYVTTSLTNTLRKFNKYDWSEPNDPLLVSGKGYWNLATDNNYLYISSDETGTIDVVHLGSFQIVESVSSGSPYLGRIGVDSRYVYAATMYAPYVYIFDTKELIPESYNGAALTHNGKILMASYDSPSHLILDTELDVAARIEDPTSSYMGNHTGFTRSPANIDSYSISSDGHISIYNTYSEELRKIQMPSGLTGDFSNVTLCAMTNGRVISTPNDVGKFISIDQYGVVTAHGLPSGLVTSYGWHASAVSPTGLMYCIPTNGSHVVIIDPVSLNARILDLGISFSGNEDYKSAVVGPDSKIYCAPYNADHVLIIDPILETAKLVDYGLDFSGVELYKGGVMNLNGKIIFAPYNANSPLIIEPTLPTDIPKNVVLSAHLNRS